ncbi:MAG: hypothetical protein H6730_10305 [Deltaproteobacteria bacterium]|nr:hypothetical protein [Deltaproteobacteria bacterium]
MMPDAALALLHAHGYAVRFRSHEWVECLVTRDEEAWVGRGPDREAALEVALAQACPSALSQAFLRKAMMEEVAAPPPPRPVADLARPTPRGPQRPVPPLVTRAPPEAPNLERTLEELTVLKERIKGSREELGLCTPERQRLAILAWICEARAHTEPFPGEPRVRDGVASISRILTDFGKAFWPGSVTALQLQMTPADLPRHLLGGHAPTWARASELAEAALQAAVLRDDGKGFDAYGWSDEAALWPPLRDATERLQALLHEVETAGGSVDKHAAARTGSARPDPGTFQRWVRTLRWLRGAGVDADRWSRVAGRLRWWAGRRDPALANGVRELEPTFTPDRAWSEVMGERHEADVHHGDLGAALPSPLVARVRDRTRGKRLVWVGPRRDPRLLEVLHTTLAGAELDWRVSEPTRLQALGADIEGGRYDLVLAALGLQAKQHDLLLARACKKGGINYVRVHRGEAWSCLRGLERTLGAR